MFVFSSGGGLGGVVLCRVKVKSEQASLGSFTEDGCCPDIGE